MRGGRHEAGIEAFRTASDAYDRIGESEYVGATRYQEGVNQYENGDTLAGYGLFHESLRILRRVPGSVWLNRALGDMTRYAARDGLMLSALAIQDDAFLAARAGTDRDLMDALLARAELRAATGNVTGARLDLDSAGRVISRLDSAAQTHFGNLLPFARASLDATSSASVEELDSAVAYFSNRVTLNPGWWMAVVSRRAELHLKRGDLEGVRTDLDLITAQIRGRTEHRVAYHLRSALIEQARTRFDQLVMLHVRAGRPLDALEALERGRISFGLTWDVDAARGTLQTRPGEVVLEYALIGDRLLTWIIRDGSMIFRQRQVPRDELLLAIERTDRALATPRQAHLADLHLRQMHEWLIRPVKAHLGEQETRVTVIADGEIAAVPFAALFDARSERYLIEDHPLRFAASLADANRPELPRDTHGLRALLVADPAFDPAKHPTLDPLDGARGEVDSLRGIYPDADTLSGGNATVEALRARAPRVDVIHYAGHAMFDDTRPELSFLVMADSGRLSADSVDSLDLRRVRMVVLSACSTLRARQGRSGGFAGLSSALLSAGAGGVVGSLWKANDKLTQPLMVAFHREYRESGLPADALRAAQIEMRRQGQSPAVWGGFRYVGR